MNTQRPAQQNKKQDDKAQFLLALRSKGERRIKVGIKILGFLMLMHLLIAYLKQGHLELDALITQKITILAACTSVTVILQFQPRFIDFAPFIVMFVVSFAATENGIIDFPHEMTFPGPFIAISANLNYFNSIIMVRKSLKNIQVIIVYGYYIVRCYIQYGSLDQDITVPIFAYLLVNNATSSFYESTLNKISELYNYKEQITNEKFDTTLEFIPQGIMVININDGHISYSNQETLRMLQIDNSDQIIPQLQEYWKKEKISTPEGSAQNLSTQSSPLNLYDYLFMKCHKSNQEIDLIFKNRVLNKYFQVRASIINQNSQVIALLNDITRIKHLESQSKKMRSMFFASVAHELRTPLNSIIPMAQRLQTLVKDDHVQNIVKLIKNSSIFLQNIIEDALDMSRLENNKFQLFEEYFDVRGAVQDVTEIMDFQIKQKSLKMITEISDKVPYQIKIDQKRFKQVLFNLIGNAVKFTFKGSIKIKMEFEDGILSTSIIDSGIGIQQENIKKLFKFFGQISDQKKINKGGMGFGLTISKMILQQFNGEISATSVLDQGSNFNFKFKVNEYKMYQEIDADDQNSEESKRDEGQHNNFERNHQFSESYVQRKKHARRISLGSQRDSFYDSYNSEDDIEDFASNKLENLNSIMNQSANVANQALSMNAEFAERINCNQRFRVLLVDDSGYNLFVLKELLSQIDTIEIIETALNGKEPLDILLLPSNIGANNECLFNYVLIDLHMPIMDGFQAVKHLIDCQQQKLIDLINTKIIAASAITKDQFKNSMYSELFDGFLEKPVDFDYLAQIFK